MSQHCCHAICSETSRLMISFQSFLSLDASEFPSLSTKRSTPHRRNTTGLCLAIYISFSEVVKPQAHCCLVLKMVAEWLVQLWLLGQFVASNHISSSLGTQPSLSKKVVGTCCYHVIYNGLIAASIITIMYLMNSTKGLKDEQSCVFNKIFKAGNQKEVIHKNLKDKIKCKQLGWRWAVNIREQPLL